MLKYYSVGHRARMLRLARKNPRLLEQFPTWMRWVVSFLMNVDEICLAQYRSKPSLRWLYDRLTPYNKYKYVADLFRGTHFWGKEWEPALFATGEAVDGITFWRKRGRDGPGTAAIASGGL